MSTVAIVLFTLWVAVVALASLVVRIIGVAKIRQFPLTAGLIVLSLLAAPLGGILRLSRPVYARVRPYFRHVKSPDIPASSGCPMFPDDNVWNTKVRDLPESPDSAKYIASIGLAAPLHADFGAHAGYEFRVVDNDQPPVNVAFTDYGSESDQGPYRIPDDTPIERAGDHHAMVLDLFHCQLYELFGAARTGPAQWQAASGAIFDLRSNHLRPDTWTSADAAGFAILPGLVRYDEVKSGHIDHAIRFTARLIRNTYVWPARHRINHATDPSLPPMGQRFRLRGSFDVTQFSPETRVILRAMQDYGILLADGGGNWFVSGTMDSRWPTRVPEELRQVRGSDFEAVDESGLMVDPNSGQAKK